MSESIAKLFTDDPLNLTDADIDAMVAHLEVLGARWLHEEEEARISGKPARSAKVKLTTVDLLSLKLGDLS
jgi:hypothetical protein